MKHNRLSTSRARELFYQMSEHDRQLLVSYTEEFIIEMYYSQDIAITMMNNYMQSSFVSSKRKQFATVLMNSLRQWVNSIIRTYKYAFINRFSIFDQQIALVIVLDSIKNNSTNNIVLQEYINKYPELTFKMLEKSSERITYE